MPARVFRQPYTNATATVGLRTIVWTALSGPFYYWAKGAIIEGTLMCVLALPPLFIDPDTSGISADRLDDIAWIVWGAFVLLSPLLMAWSYQRRAWVEITDG
jgi:hypothetical protein